MKKKTKKSKPKYGYDIAYVDLTCWGGEKFKHPKNTGGFVLSWCVNGIGFGELAFIQDKKRGLICEDEGMSREFIDDILKYFLDNTVKCYT